MGVLQPTHFVLLETVGSSERQLLRISRDGYEYDTGFDAALLDMKRRGTRMAVQLGTELGLRKTLKLPIAAKNDLNQLLRFEMDRISPFAAEDVHFAHRILQIIENERCLVVEVHIVPRTFIERALATCKYLGLEPKHVCLAGADADNALNLLPPDAIRSRRSSRIDWALAGIAAVFAGLVVVTPLQKQHTTAVYLERQVIVEQTEAEKNQTLRRQLEILTSTILPVIARKQSGPPVTHFVAELTRLIQDDAYLVELHIDSKGIILRGYGRSASDVIHRLEKSASFGKTRFLSPITRNAANDLEYFEILVGLPQRSE